MKKCFAYRGAETWINLPADIKSERSISTFKIWIFLFHIIFLFYILIMSVYLNYFGEIVQFYVNKVNEVNKEYWYPDYFTSSSHAMIL